MATNLTILLQDLPKSGRQWCLNVPQEVLADVTVGKVDAVTCLCTDAHWQASICRAGDIYMLSGEWQTAVKRKCSRCMVDFSHHIEGESQRSFRLGSTEMLEDEDNTCDILPLPGQLDLLDVLREDIWLSWKSVVICKSDCLGLCQKCGQSLNDGACLCPQQGDDHPFAGLKNFRFDA